MSRKDRIKDLYSLPPADKLAMANSPSPSENKEADRVPAGPVRSMGLALGRMEEETKALQSALATGSQVVELEPAVVDVSMVRDRLASGGNADFDALKRSIEDRGQEVPILVRPHPAADGRFQVAYGHRRLRAVKDLGRKVKAVVRNLSDEELIIAQGIENSARQDLSYIERALFAARLEDRGFERTIIMDALSTDKGELSKLITVARSIPESLIEVIGPAPKAGRRRWLALAETFERPASKRAAEKAIKDSGFDELDSDTRFIKVLAAATKAAEAKGIKPDVLSVATVSGQKIAQVTKSGRDLKILIDKKFDAEFSDFLVGQLAQQLPILAELFAKAREEET